MGKERKVIVGLVGIVLLALLAFVMIDAIVAVGVLVVGVLGGAVILRRTADVPIPRRTKSRSKSAKDSPLGLLDSTPTSPSSAAALLPTWTPPTESVDAPAIDAPVDDDPTSGSDGSWSDGDSWSEGSTWSSESVSFESNPLDDLNRLDEVDVVAEVERLEARDTVLDEPAPFETSFDAPFETSFDTPFETSFDTAPAEPATSTFESSFLAPINEEVSSPDDIMAASQATELSIATAADDNSELAKLLAKVQQRLAAYE